MQSEEPETKRRRIEQEESDEHEELDLDTEMPLHHDNMEVDQELEEIELKQQLEHLKQRINKEVKAREQNIKNLGNAQKLLSNLKKTPHSKLNEEIKESLNIQKIHLKDFKKITKELLKIYKNMSSILQKKEKLEKEQEIRKKDKKNSKKNKKKLKEMEEILNELNMSKTEIETKKNKKLLNICKKEKNIREKIIKSMGIRIAYRFKSKSKNKSKDDTNKILRKPHKIHRMEETNLNYFRNNISEISSKRVKSTLLNKDIIYLFAITENDEVILGIENPFSLDFKYYEEEEKKKLILILNELLDSIVIDIIDSIKIYIEDKLGITFTTSITTTVGYSDSDLIDIIKKIIRKDPEIQNDNNNTSKISHLISNNIEIQKFIIKQMQLGHPSLIKQKNKKALIGGELEYIKHKSGGKWTLRNISGRYGNPNPNTGISQEKATAFNAKYLLLAEKIFKSNGILNITSEIFYKEGRTNEYLKRLIIFTNEVIGNYRRDGKIKIDKSVLCEIIRDKKLRDVYLYVMGTIPSDHPNSVLKLKK